MNTPNEPAAPRFHLYQCTRDACGLRFPQEVHAQPAEVCPRCGGAIRLVAEYGAAPVRTPPHPGTLRRGSLDVLVDNVRSAFNVGAMLRTADGAGVGHLHLCGITPPGDHPRVGKTALGAQESVAWTHHPNGLRVAQALRAQGALLIGLEGGAAAESLFEMQPLPPDAHGVLVVGSEITGVDPGILALCHRVVSLPMVGVKESLNVAVALAVAVYQLQFGQVQFGQVQFRKAGSEGAKES